MCHTSVHDLPLRPRRSAQRHQVPHATTSDHSAVSQAAGCQRTIVTARHVACPCLSKWWGGVTTGEGHSFAQPGEEWSTGADSRGAARALARRRPT